MDNLNDLILRAAACECIGKMIHEYREKGEDDLADGMILARRYGIKRLPAVDAAPVVHAYWIEKRWTTEYDWGCTNHFSVVCSACSNEIYKGMKSPYCPNCGAKMDGRDDDAAD